MKIQEAISRYGNIKHRFILRLGKQDGKFESLHADSPDQDFYAFKLCLQLSRIHSIIEARIASEKKAKTAAKRAAKGKHAKKTKTTA